MHEVRGWLKEANGSTNNSLLTLEKKSRVVAFRETCQGKSCLRQFFCFLQHQTK